MVSQTNHLSLLIHQQKRCLNIFLLLFGHCNTSTNTYMVLIDEISTLKRIHKTTDVSRVTSAMNLFVRV